jgi:hypothetical protein
MKKLFSIILILLSNTVLSQTTVKVPPPYTIQEQTLYDSNGNRITSIYYIIDTSVSEIRKTMAHEFRKEIVLEDGQDNTIFMNFNQLRQMVIDTSVSTHRYIKKQPIKNKKVKQ